MELGYFGRAIFIRHLILSKNMDALFFWVLQERYLPTPQALVEG
ncbi:hypothetical protein SOHN41_02944 [Shewanella sp. HN-41]|nr:hypothetical protein SOHN41_02944 [Shewanella sp. HN-41]